MIDVIYIDIEEGLKRVMNNSALYSKLLLKFKEYTHVSEIEAALEQGEMEKAQNSAHTLKGLAANLSFTELYKKVQEIEAQIKSGSVDNEILGQLKNVYVKTMEEADKVIEQNA